MDRVKAAVRRAAWSDPTGSFDRSGRSTISDVPPAYTPASTSATTSAESVASTTPAETPYAFLAQFDTIFLIDDSGSMAGRSWRETSAALSAITPICTRHDADGIDIHFLNRHHHAQSAFGGYKNTASRYGQLVSSNLDKSISLSCLRGENLVTGVQEVGHASKPIKHREKDVDPFVLSKPDPLQVDSLRNLFRRRSHRAVLEGVMSEMPGSVSDTPLGQIQVLESQDAIRRTVACFEDQDGIGNHDSLSWSNADMRASRQEYLQAYKCSIERDIRDDQLNRSPDPESLIVHLPLRDSKVITNIQPQSAFSLITSLPRGFAGMTYALLPTIVAARPIQSKGELGPTSLAESLRHSLDFTIGLSVGIILQAGICIIIAWGTKRLPSSREQQINRVQSHGLTSLLAASVALYVLQQNHKSQDETLNPVVLGGITIFWLTSHIMFWMENFRLHKELASWHLLMPWLVGGTGVMLCLLSETADKAAWSVCMFWLPILTWPLVVSILTQTVQFLDLFGSHLFAFRDINQGEL